MRLASAGLVALVALATTAPAMAQPALTEPVPATPAVIVPTPREAHGVYFTESFGGVRVHDELSNFVDGGVRLRAALGYRKGNLAVELWVAGVIGWSDEFHSSHAGYLSSPSSIDERPDGGHHHNPGTSGLAMWGVDAKYIKTMSRHLEVYARAGLSTGIANAIDASGRGIGLGAGAQLKGKVPAIGFLFWPLFFTGLGPKVTAALYVETGYEFYRFHGVGRSTDAQLNNVMFGFAVGSDF